MPSKDPKKCCHTDVMAAVRQAHFAQNLPFKHTCDTSIHNHKTVTPTPGRVINEYNEYISAGKINYLLIPQEPYGVCHVLKKKIDGGLKKRDREAAEAAATNNNTNATIRDPHGSVDVTATASAANINNDDPSGVGAGVGGGGTGTGTGTIVRTSTTVNTIPDNGNAAASNNSTNATNITNNTSASTATDTAARKVASS